MPPLLFLVLSGRYHPSDNYYQEVDFNGLGVGFVFIETKDIEVTVKILPLTQNDRKLLELFKIFKQA